MQAALNRPRAHFRHDGTAAPSVVACAAPRRGTRRVLRRFAALHALSPPEHAAVCAACGPAVNFAPDTDMVVEGERISRGYVVEEGWACRYRLLRDGRRQILGFIVPGDCIGWFAAGVGDGVADHSVATLTRCRAHPFAPADLAAVRRKFPAVRAAFDRTIRRDLAMLRERVVDLGRRTARERLANLLLELRHRLGRVGLSDGRAFELPVTQETVADALGLSVVHVNRILRRLSAEAVIRYRPGSIALLDPGALAAMAEFRGDGPRRIANDGG